MTLIFDLALTLATLFGISFGIWKLFKWLKFRVIRAKVISRWSIRHKSKIGDYAAYYIIAHMNQLGYQEGRYIFILLPNYRIRAEMIVTEIDDIALRSHAHDALQRYSQSDAVVEVEYYPNTMTAEIRVLAASYTSEIYD